MLCTWIEVFFVTEMACIPWDFKYFFFRFSSPTYPMKKFQEILTSTWEPDDSSPGAKCILLCVLCTLCSALIYTTVKNVMCEIIPSGPNAFFGNCAESRMPCVRYNINSRTTIQPVFANFFAPVLTSDLLNVKRIWRELLYHLSFIFKRHFMLMRFE